jgi:hypothetical protein
MQENNSQKKNTENSIDKLKACPFCASTKINDYDYIKEQQCGTCGAKAIVYNWNHRPIESALQARIDALTIPDDVRHTVTSLLEVCLEEKNNADWYKNRLRLALDYFTEARNDPTRLDCRHSERMK